MSKSAAGTIEEPGKMVRQKAGLNRCILDQGWGMFRSQTCPNPDCGYISAENRKTQNEFRCVNCGYENNADVVGATNTLERGLRLLACGESVKLNRSMKQEPTEVSQLAFS